MPFDVVSAAGSSQCDHAALEGDDVELWLIRCPPGFDASELHDRTIDLSQEATILGSGSQATGYSLRPIPACEGAGVVGVFPSAQRKRWLMGKPLARQFAISRTAAGAASLVVPESLQTIPQVPGLRLRNASIGSSGPSASAPASDRKRAADEPPPGSEGKKKSKKKSEAKAAAGKEAKAESGKKKAKKSATNGKAEDQAS